jgi:4'-phosphopantetheinyl transferase
MSVGTALGHPGGGMPQDFEWAPGPADPRLAPGELHVWRADLASVSEDALACLSPDERERAARILNARKAWLWARSRGVLRILLGRYLSADPTKLCFGAESNGKPALEQPAGALRLCFNVSHSGGLALYAFTQASAVGVDVQLARGMHDEVAVAARALGAGQTRRLASLPPAEREREFLRAWVRHEAVLKCRGTEIGGPRTNASRGNGEPWVTALDVNARAAAAIAVERRPRNVRCWAWTNTS